MPLTDNYDTRKKIEITFIAVLVTLSVIYGSIKAYPLIVGPRITIYNPRDGDTVPRSTFEISGKVSRVKEITLNGRPIPIGTDGHFAEILIAQSPYTILILTATDFYGKTVTKILRVIPE
jgi:hypothetical protein